MKLSKQIYKSLLLFISGFMGRSIIFADQVLLPCGQVLLHSQLCFLSTTLVILQSARGES